MSACVCLTVLQIEYNTPFFLIRGPLTAVASPVAEHRLQMRRLSGHGSQAQPLCSIWDPPGPGHEPVSPASAGGLSTTAPPGKPSYVLSSCKSLSQSGLSRFAAKNLPLPSSCWSPSVSAHADLHFPGSWLPPSPFTHPLGGTHPLPAAP